MLLQCRKSCGTCGITDRLELDALIEKKVALHEVGGDETLLETPYGVTQTLDVKTQAGIKEVIKNFTSYMDSVVFKDPRYETVKKTCRNRHRDCAFWAHLGECENVSRIMQCMIKNAERSLHVIYSKQAHNRLDHLVFALKLHIRMFRTQTIC